MGKARQRVRLSEDIKTRLVSNFSKQSVPPSIIVRENPRTITHYHSYGGISRFFDGLARSILMGTSCDTCQTTGIWLPPRVHCPDCWSVMRWVIIDTRDSKVYTHSMTNYPGAGFKASVPCPLISVEIPGVCTKFMSYLSEFGEGEPYVGMSIRPIFKPRPTYTILDISWASIEI